LVVTRFIMNISVPLKVASNGELSS